MKTKTITDTFKSPIGTIFITACDKKVYEVATRPTLRTMKGKNELSKKVITALQEYFKNGTDPLALLKGVNFSLDAGTEFQQKVWKELKKIKVGKSLSYGELAQKIKAPKAYRAVGSAVGKNPFLIILPCHRILAANKKIGGFSAGPSKKKFLLKHENLEFVSR